MDYLRKLIIKISEEVQLTNSPADRPTCNRVPGVSAHQKNLSLTGCPGQVKKSIAVLPLLEDVTHGT